MPTKQDHATPAMKILGLYGLLLFSGRAFSLIGLAKILRCSKQTVLRMVEQIQLSKQAQIDEWISEDGQRWYRAQRPGNKPNVSLSEEEVESLTLCRDLIWGVLPKPMRSQLNHAIGKSTVLLPDWDKRKQAQKSIGTSMAKGYIDYTPHQQHLSDMMVAIREKKVCLVTYRAPNRDQPKAFHVAPFRIVAYRETLYVHAWRVSDTYPVTLVYDDPTPLALQRVVETKLMTYPFEWDENWIEDQKLFGVFQGELFQVRVRFLAEVADYVRERQWSEDQHIEDDPDGSIVLTFTATSKQEVVSWLLGFGSKARFLEPIEIRDQIQAEIGQLANIYQPTDVSET